MTGHSSTAALHYSMRYGALICISVDVVLATNTAEDLAWRTSRAAIGTTGGDDELDEMRVNPGTEWHEDRTLAILGASGRSERNERPPAARRRVARR
ncbi:hypothetical protein PF005_g33286 [Phytophthora fragariae]|uniref:Uncharacterized protein n=1 Tax=Phytophthora fragariae TaxID=53985 RepID=A0A6A3V178_9STRA|nr:hypothetical protein PF006_g33208 [Phytophthora fragariae]KAE9156252.1 hypothetical protein PF005_g33286 [Phytophthora fragariae]KAE9157844.1 hypothetical protein PF002_g33272 [Phytophthora fragariae]KAE9259172.1 hypothetical protein PF001_g33118 [Phytophthora fragariae]